MILIDAIKIDPKWNEQAAENNCWILYKIMELTQMKQKKLGENYHSSYLVSIL